MKARIVDFLPVSSNSGRLTLDMQGDFRKAYDTVKDSEFVEVTVERLKEKRSRDANAYCWVLIYKIAAKVGREPTEVYRDLIRRFPTKTKVVCCSQGEMESEIHEFCDGHLGRMVDIGDSKFEGYVVLHKKYGSSSFNTEQMGQFIEKVIDQAEELEIEVRSDEYITALMNEWEKNHG